MIEDRIWLQDELHKVEAWEKNQSGLWFWERLGRLPFKLLDRFTPAFIQNKIGLLLDELGHYVQTGGGYLSSAKRIPAYFPGHDVTTLEDIQDLSIQTMGEAVDKLAKGRRNVATVQGASTGFGGILTLSLDIPLLLGLQLKTLQDIAICYGYDPKEKKERLFIIKCLQFVSADVVGKQAILKQLSAYDKEGSVEKREAMSELQGWREVVFSYRDNFGWKKLFQMVPVAGLVFGAFINRSAINDIAEAGQMLYRKRRILERLQMDEGEA